MFKYLLVLFSTFFLCCFGAKLPDLTGHDVTKKSEEALEAHATHKKFDRLIAQRSLLNYLESLDPVKTYFIAPEIEIWTHPSDTLLDQLISEYQNGNFSIFEKIYTVFAAAIQRRQAINAQISYSNLPTQVKAEEFKDLTWVNTEAELIDRLRRLRSLQVEAASKLSKELQETALLRMAKREAKYQEEMLPKNPNERQKLIFKNVLKSIISSLDAHSAYFTPAEAVQFMINVQQRLFGIGVQLRDDINGFIIVKIVEGSPAALEKQLKVKDRIIGVNGEVVIGMDIEDAVELIRGEENTRVLLTVVRRVHQPDGSNIEETLDISVPRGRVVLNEYR